MKIVKPFEKFDGNNLNHCDNGPAVQTPDGCQIWYRHGIIHRDDGPAFTSCYDYMDHNLYFLNGKPHSFQNWINNINDPIAVLWINHNKKPNIIIKYWYKFKRFVYGLI